MKKYICHKEVWADKIIEVLMHFSVVHDRMDYTLRLQDTGLVYAPEHFCARSIPEVGDYYVIYSDGYESFSPAKVFEEGYSEIKE